MKQFDIHDLKFSFNLRPKLPKLKFKKFEIKEL